MADVAINALSIRQGGGLQVIAGLATRLSEKHNYTILCSDEPSRGLFKTIIGERSNIVYVDPLGSTRNSAVFLWSLTRLAYWLKRNRFKCVVNVNHHYPSGAVAQIVYHLNVSLFERSRASIVSSGEIVQRLRDWRAATALRSADANVFESNTILDVARRTGIQIRNPSVVYIGLDDRCPVETVSLEKESRGNLLAITSAAAHKDNDTLVLMLSQLVNELPIVNWKLKVAGGVGAEDFDSLLTLAEDNGVVERLEFLGFVDHQRLTELGQSSLCLVSASLAESFCMVALEAMSWGCPTIVADCSSMPESVGDAALLAKPRDAKDFASKVISLYNDNDLRLEIVRRGLRRVTNMTWSKAAQGFEARIDRILVPRQSP